MSPLSITVEHLARALAEVILEEGESRVGEAHDVGSEEGCDDADRHDDGVEIGVGHMEALSEIGYDEGKLTYLHQ